MIPFFYFFPVLYIQYITAHLHKDLYKNDDIMYWFTLETFVFVSQVFGGILFMISSYYLRFFSIWNQSKPDHVHLSEDGETETFIPNIFYKKKTSDYMHYMKFEAFNWILQGSFMTLDCLMVYIHFSMKDSIYGVSPAIFAAALFVMIGTHLAVLIVFSYQLACKHKNEDRFKILPKHVDWWQYVLMGLAACGYIFTSCVAYSIKKGDDKWILVHWVWIEAVSFPFIILYGLLQRHYLKNNCQ